MSAKNEKNIHAIDAEPFVWEFGGILGTALMTIGLPIMTYYLCAAAYFGDLLLPSSLTFESLQNDTFSRFNEFLWTKCNIDCISFIMYSLWFFMQILADRLLPGEEVYGQPVPELKGKRLKYVMNGWNAWIFTNILTLLILYQFPLLNALIMDRIYSILTVAQFYALCISMIAYFIGYQSKAGCRLSGYFVYDFFMGYARVPRIGEFDLKLFCEARPGLQLWILLDAVMVIDHYQNHGVLDASMSVVLLMQYIYITDYFWFEDCILTTMDLIHDKFGFMLSFGDLVLVPWTYTLQIQCLYFYHQRNPEMVHMHSHNDFMKWSWLSIMSVLFIAGYIIFRVSNLQKHRFRTKMPGEYEYIDTSRGSKLLVSGWWGIGRHMNYTGDWMMSCAQSMCCDCFSFCAAPSSVLVYFNPIYFAILLVHRERRDHIRCAAKYGKDWDVYCDRVKWRMIPYIY